MCCQTAQPALYAIAIIIRVAIYGLSNPDNDLPSNIEIQLVMIYRDAVKDKELAVTSLLVQQQKKGYDCGLFAIAFKNHMARGDDVTGRAHRSAMANTALLKFAC